MDLEALLSIMNRPFYYKGKFYNSKVLAQNETCSQICKSKDCIEFYKSTETSNNYTCQRTLQCYVYVSQTNEKVLINGLIIDGSSEKIKNSFRIKHRLTKAAFDLEIKQWNILLASLDSGNEGMNPQFSILHDVKTTIGVILSHVELLINLQTGSNFKERLANCNQELLDLYDSVDLASSQLSMIDAVVNPGKIKHGLKRNINVYRLFERVSRLFRAKAQRKNITITWHSEHDVRDGMYFESIEFLPIILLDNAIKYSYREKDIKVYFSVNKDILKIKCSSFGEYVPPEDRELIFEKFKRGANAHITDGHGIGLWLLKQIVKAHDGRIEYSFEGNGTVGANNFVIYLGLS